MFAVHADIAAAIAHRAVVVGAGYIGLELADAFTHRGWTSRSLRCSTRSWRPSTPSTEHLEHHGVTVVAGVTVHAIEPDGPGLRICADDGADQPADVVVAARVHRGRAAPTTARQTRRMCGRSGRRSHSRCIDNHQ